MAKKVGRVTGAIIYNKYMQVEAIAYTVYITPHIENIW